MDVIAGRKTGGFTSGEVLVNGELLNEQFHRVSGYCLGEDMQVLTSRGFMFRAELRAAYESDPTLLVAAYAQERGTLVYERPQRFVDKPLLRREFVEFTHCNEALHWDKDSSDYGCEGAERSNGLSMRVTANHDMLVAECRLPTTDAQRRGVVGFVKRKAKDLLSDDVNAGLMFKCTMSNGFEPILEPLFERVPFLRTFGFAQRKANWFLQLYGCWLGDGGSLEFATCGNDDAAVMFAAPVKRADARFLSKALGKLGLCEGRDFSRSATQQFNGAAIERFRVTKRSWVRAFFDQYARKYDKPRRVLPAEQEPPVWFSCEPAKWCWFWVWKLGCAEMRKVIDGLTLANGDDRGSIATSSPTFRDEVMRMQLHAGRSPHFRLGCRAGTVRSDARTGGAIVARHDHWEVRVRDQEKRMLLRPAKEVRAETKVERAWCLTMPSGTLVVRRAHAARATDGAGRRHRVVTKASRPVVVHNCEQQDLHIGNATVLESVVLAAHCRLDRSVEPEMRERYARDTVQLLGLSAESGMKVDELTTEQRKRLTVAVELAANPGLLFLDEPTSGLGAIGARRVMEVVRNEAEHGRSCVVTIHQPSSYIFSLFTHLLLLKRGGEVIYFGPIGRDGATVREYFARELDLHMDELANPADFALECASPAADCDRDPAEVWRNSAECARVNSVLERIDADRQSLKQVLSSADATTHQIDAAKRLAAAANGNDDDDDDNDEGDEAALSAPHRELSMDEANPEVASRMSMEPVLFENFYAATFWTQCRSVLYRSWTTLYRQADASRIKVVKNLFLGLLTGAAFWQMGNDQVSIGLRASIFFLLLLLASFNAFTLIPIIMEERPAFYRERASGTYPSLVYLIAFILSNLPWSLAGAVCFCVPVYWMAGFQYEAGPFFFYLLVAVLSSLVAQMFSQFISFSAANAEAAAFMGGVPTLLFNLLAGFFVPPSEMGFWIFGYYISFTRYSLQSLMINEVDGVEFECPNNEGAIPYQTANGIAFYCQITSGQDALDAFEITEISSKWILAGILTGFYFIFILFSWFALQYMKHLNR
jgi:ABC-type multidrug transport system ATPase subunit